MFSRRKKLVAGLGLALASWVVVALALWAPLRALPALRRGGSWSALDLASLAGTLVVTVPLVAAAAYVTLRRLVLDPRDDPEHHEDPPEP